MIQCLDEVSTKIWGCSSAGRAPALQAGGQEFDPPHLHQFEQFNAPKLFLLRLVYRCTRRRCRKHLMHTNLSELHFPYLAGNTENFILIVP